MTQTLWRDTSEEAERVYITALRGMSVAGRLLAVADMITTAQALMLAGLRYRPDSTDAGAYRRLVDLWFGSTLAHEVKRAYGEACSRARGKQGAAGMKTALDVLLYVIEQLEALRIPYLLGGSWASMAHGAPRATQDADLLIQLDPSAVDALVSALEESFYISPEAVREAIAWGASFTVIPLGIAFKIDLFVAPDRPYERMEMSRRRPYEITHDPRRVVYVATPEDSVLTKLRWYRQGNHASQQQWNDVLGVLTVQGEALDRGYLEHWAGVLGVRDLLARALGEASGA